MADPFTMSMIMSAVGGTMISGMLDQAAPDRPRPGAAAETALKPPVAEKPKVAPTPDDLSVKRKKQRTAQRIQGAGGRAGTMLTDSDKLG